MRDFENLTVYCVQEVRSQESLLKFKCMKYHLQLNEVYKLPSCICVRDR